MAVQYNKLEDVLRIADALKREQSLIAYARSLGVDVEDARKADGKIDQDRLTVLIFNAQRTKTFFRLRDRGAWFGAILIFLMLLAGISLAIRMKMIRLWQ